MQSERRQELIEWVTQRFMGRIAMSANYNCYAIRGATRDVARLLGWSHDTAGDMTGVLPYSGRPRKIRQYREALEMVVGASPLLEVLLSLTERLDDCPRDLGLHSGGMLLARDSIFNHSALKRSANGTLQTFLDKRTSEASGLVKLDLLGLLSLDVLQTTLELLEGEGIQLKLEEVDLDDPRIFASLQDGKVIGLFQIESPAQQALLAQLQPTTFLDLVAQVALIRPGPIQALSVRPYIKRRNGLERVTYPHPSLEPVLKQTYGLMVFQDQAIETAQTLCGMSVDEADRFRKLVSKARDREDMEGMREEFVRRALETHPDLTLEVAGQVFEIDLRFFWVWLSFKSFGGVCDHRGPHRLPQNIASCRVFGSRASTRARHVPAPDDLPKRPTIGRSRVTRSRLEISGMRGSASSGMRVAFLAFACHSVP